MVRPIDYDQHQSDVYAQGRELPPEAVSAWMHGFARHVGDQRPLTVLDLGSGTGRFTPALADTFGGPTYGVEPSDRMRAIAETSAGHPMVTYLAGSAEHIPLPSASCDLVLLFLSFHHVTDRDAAVREIARVLRPGPASRVMIRSTFADRMPDLLWHRYFPRARAIEQEMFPTVDAVEAAFGVSGLHRVALDQVRQRFAPSLAAYAARLRLRAISTFEHLNADELQDGFNALDSDAAAEVEPRPVEADSDLLVLGRGRLRGPHDLSPWTRATAPPPGGHRRWRTENTTPSGSVSTAMRPTPARSNGATLTVPPS